MTLTHLISSFAKLSTRTESYSNAALNRHVNVLSLTVAMFKFDAQKAKPGPCPCARGNMRVNAHGAIIQDLELDGGLYPEV